MRIILLLALALYACGGPEAQTKAPPVATRSAAPIVSASSSTVASEPDPLHDVHRLVRGALI